MVMETGVFIEEGLDVLHEVGGVRVGGIRLMVAFVVELGGMVPGLSLGGIYLYIHVFMKGIVGVDQVLVNNLS